MKVETAIVVALAMLGIPVASIVVSVILMIVKNHHL